MSGSLTTCEIIFGSRCLVKRTEHAGKVRSSLNRVPNPIIRMQDNQGSPREMEDFRWQREEKRWLREEERWFREENRWAVERKSLLEQTVLYQEEIKALKLEIAQLENQLQKEISRDGTLSELIVSLTGILQSLGMATLRIEDQNASFQAQISSSSSSTKDIRTALASISVDTPNKSVETATAVSQPSIPNLKSAPGELSSSYTGSRRVLKRGTEGEDVEALQKALAKLGFYSGDEDMEYSTFSSGTERAVRSWQASLGALEDGIVTADLLKRLFNETSIAGERVSLAFSQEEAETSAKVANGVSSSVVQSADGKVKMSDVSVTTSSNVNPARTASSVDSSNPSKPTYSTFDPSQARVYLLGENRWEEPSRLLSKNGPTSATPIAGSLNEKCSGCKGQGSTMCTECEGTGELNVEEQFLEWADEGAKCPYCEGQGLVDCDVCDGKGVKATA